MINNHKLQTTNHKLVGGFTLVELSIVLVIIGLLTAGVVGGQSLVESAKRQRLVTEFTSIKTGSKAFYLEYNGLPGDITDASSYWPTCLTTYVETNVTSCNGNGDGLIGYPSWMETHSFWVHLELSNVIPDTSQGGGEAHHKSAYGNNSILFARYSDWGLDYPEKNNIIFSKAGATIYDAIVTPAEAKKIDSKIDDGLPSSGILVGVNGGNGSTYSGTCLASSAYSLTNTGIACVLAFNID